MTGARACRVCGCTDDRACVTNGQPRSWVETGLRSACKAAPQSVFGQIADALAELYGDADKEHRWLHTPQALLGGERPERVLATGGGADVLHVLKGLIEGIYQ